MQEELVSKEEALRTNYVETWDHDGYFVIPSQFDTTDNYKELCLMTQQEFTSATAYKLTKEEIIHLLDEMQHITDEDKKIWENGFHTPRGE